MLQVAVLAFVELFKDVYAVLTAEVHADLRAQFSDDDLLLLIQSNVDVYHVSDHVWVDDSVFTLIVSFLNYTFKRQHICCLLVVFRFNNLALGQNFSNMISFLTLDYLAKSLPI